MDYVEFPKWVLPPGAEEPVIVETKEEETEVMTVNAGKRGRKVLSLPE
jgi:hypothetical protein